MHILFKKKNINKLLFTHMIFICNLSFAKEINYYLELNTIYDGAVVTNFSDTNSNPLSDTGTNITHGVDIYINKNMNLNYEIAEENYDNVKDGDNKYKIITAEFSERLKSIVNIIYISNMNLKLADDELMANMITHSASFFLKSLYMNINNTFTKKKLKNEQSLNGDNIMSILSTYFFFNNAKTYIKFSLKKIEERLNDNIFDFNEISFSTALQHKFLLKQIKCKTYLGYSLYEKDYLKNSNNEFKTFEDKKKIKAFFEVDLDQNLSTKLLYEHQNRKTNIERYSYDSNKVVASIKYNF